MQETIYDNIDKHNPPVNLHPLFLFWKHGSVCDPEKNRSKYGPEKSKVKKQGHCYSKREEARLLFLFLNNNDHVFGFLLFSGAYFGPDFFKVADPKKIPGRPDELR